MTTRADRIKTAAAALMAERDGTLVSQATAVLDAVLPQITTVEQLKALPGPSLVVDSVGEKYAAWEISGWNAGHLEHFGPLTVVWQPQPEQETP